MIAATIGRTFLNAWNKKNNLDYSPKEFFEKEFFTLFFDHSKYMQWITNSPFVQMKKGQKPETLSHEERIEKMNDLHEKINSGLRDASIAIGFPASEEKEYATTSGLVTDIVSEYDADSVYLSWIGGGLGVGVAGGYSIFFNDAEILLKIQEGWTVYRKFLNDETLSLLRGNQINTWNGQWLSFACDDMDYEENPDFGKLTMLGVFKADSKVIEVNTIFWTKLYFNMAQTYYNDNTIAYFYSLGQTNKTIGFIPFRLKQGKSVMELYKTLFGINAALQDKKNYETLFGIHIKRACELGSIGLQALEPDGLREYFTAGKLPSYQSADITRKNSETDEAFAERQSKNQLKEHSNIISFRTYKTWLLAMITKNKQEDLHYSEEIAQALIDYRADAKKMDRANLIKNDLLQAKSKKQFLDSLATVIKDAKPEALELFKALRDRVHLMNSEDFGYFVVLLKFDFAYLERNTK